MEARRRCGIMVMADNSSSEDSGGRAWCQKCGIIEMDTAAEEMQDGNRRDVGRRRWQNGL